jgi:2,3-bisphosphoglycerate-independent phosphoglycerate mutase
MQAPRPTVLMILDGWGERAEQEGNAVALAATPNFDRLRQTCPHATLTTFGPAVGLPEGQMGNSEVGHLNIGAGRIVMQTLPRIDGTIERGELKGIVADSGFAEKVKAAGGRCHIAGLLSDGGVHSRMDHALALARILTGAGLDVTVHAFTDGRDTPPESAGGFLAEFERELPANASIGTVSGRYFAMDRDKRWDRVEKAYRALVDGEGLNAGTVAAAIEQARADGKTDEFLIPTVIGSYEGMRDGDGLVFFNFRADRARQILEALIRPGFDGFSRSRQIAFSATIGMASYGAELDPLVPPLFAPQTLEDGLAETISKAGLTQLHMAETEKYPHVTYFLNGGEETPFPGEDRILVASPPVATYDLQPEMSAPELTEKLVAAIRGGHHDAIVVNYANPDMVGHTGDIQAAIKAVETVDDALGQVCEALDTAGGQLMVIADHGNCEEMIDRQTGQPHTAHTVNPVPVIVRAPGRTAVRDGILADVAPTILDLMGLKQPEAMSGRSLLSAEA